MVWLCCQHTLKHATTSMQPILEGHAAPNTIIVIVYRDGPAERGLRGHAAASVRYRACHWAKQTTAEHLCTFTTVSSFKLHSESAAPTMRASSCLITPDAQHTHNGAGMYTKGRCYKTKLCKQARHTVSLQDAQPLARPATPPADTGSRPG